MTSTLNFNAYISQKMAVISKLFYAPFEKNVMEIVQFASAAMMSMIHFL